MKSNAILGVVAGVQALAVIATWTWSATGGPTPARPLIDLDPASVDRVTISDSPEDEAPDVVLVRDGAQWHLDTADGPLADGAEVQALLDDLLGHRVRDPISTTATSHAQLGLAETDWKRRVTLQAGEVTRTLTLGAGRDAHVRVDEDPTVWKVDDLSAWSIEARELDWLEQPYLDLELQSLEQVSLPVDGGADTLRLVKDGESWRVEPPLEDRVVDAEALMEALGGLAGLEAAALTDTAVAGGSTVSWIRSEEGQSVPGSLVIGPETETGRRVVLDPDRGFPVEVEAEAVAPLLDLDPEALITAPPAAEAEGEEG
jgi:hypothetical protein